MNAINYDEMVQLWITKETRDDSPRNGDVVDSERIGPIELWRAVRMVVVDLASNSRRQMSAQIIREQGASLMDFGAIETVYDQTDFPAKRDRG